MPKADENIVQARDDIVNYLKAELFGPAGGEEEILTEAPHYRYTLGTLYPQDSVTDTITQTEETEVTGVTGTTSHNTLSQREDQGDDPISLSNQYLPSSTGISFFLFQSSDFLIEVSGARYVETEVDKESQWKANAKGLVFQRIPLFYEQVISQDRKFIHKQDIFNGRARIHVRWRPRDDGWLVTVTLINLRENTSHSIDEQSCLHQVKIRCSTLETGYFKPYPKADVNAENLEEKINELLYRKNHIFAAGHGCSVDWEKISEEKAKSVWSEFIPKHEIFPIDYSLPEGYEDNEKCLGLFHLALGETYKDELIKDLDGFVAGYRRWIENQISENDDIQEDLFPARNVIINKLNKAAERMARGVRLLDRDKKIFKAFCLANEAMLLQHIHARDNYSGTRREPGEKKYEFPDLQQYQDRKWRPFQLAFILLTIPSIAFHEDPDRNIVDLIWFPTGGGKTEAYLATSAFLIFYRRMMYGVSGAGTAIIMRYTLRLLTAQQFQRASTLLCACEFMRQKNPELLGDSEITIGLWIGSNGAPNTFQSAYDDLNKYLHGEMLRNPIQIEKCPWCGTAIFPMDEDSDEVEIGVRFSTEHFSLFCPEKTCSFHDKLPVEVVDEKLYDHPPTLLLATVDKFARLPWVKEAGSFFGNNEIRPPELIIQDELHLISGPLGTMVGLYETAIDGLASWKGIHPKIIASTATIQRAQEQCRGLYNRTVELFPPAGLEEKDSFFTRYDETKRGRLYVGVMGQGHTPSTSMIRTSAVLLQAPIEQDLSEEARDAFWTLVAYHNSLRELGKSLNFASDDIPSRIKIIANDESNIRRLNADNCDQLTSNTGDLTKMLERLERSAGDDGALSFLVCTNMLSVGVDVQRLGLMLVNGQPKSTSEYIQATSRVGRGFPGLVVSMLSATKPRDRSHYERFKAFHSALYRHVEPSSVTPFSPPARSRALHALLVTFVRHELGLRSNSDANRFSASLRYLDKVREFIQQRVADVDPQELDNTIEQLEFLVEEWERWANNESNLKYRAPQKQIPSLLIPAGSQQSGKGWETLNSMRNVDQSCVIKIIEGPEYE